MRSKDEDLEMSLLKFFNCLPYKQIQWLGVSIALVFAGLWVLALTLGSLEFSVMGIALSLAFVSLSFLLLLLLQRLGAAESERTVLQSQVVQAQQQLESNGFESLHALIAAESFAASMLKSLPISYVATDQAGTVLACSAALSQYKALDWLQVGASIQPLSQCECYSLSAKDTSAIDLSPGKEFSIKVDESILRVVVSELATPAASDQVGRCFVFEDVSESIHYYSTLEHTLDHVSQGHFDKILSPAPDNSYYYRGLDDHINRLLVNFSLFAIDLEYITNLLKNGYVTEQYFSHPQSGDMDQLIQSIKASQSKLSEVVQGVEIISQGVFNAVREVTQGTMALRDIASNQHHSMNNAETMMNEVKSSVEQTLQASHETQSRVEQVINQMGKVDDLVLQATQAMENIKESSVKIEEITSLIDNLAFQTNLLSLNASVEAARAGEHGRGFAVVAQEVRSLAIRSADSARDIKLLINESVDRVNDGTSLIHRTRDEFSKVKEDVSHVVDFSKQLSQISQEQGEIIDATQEAIKSAAEDSQTSEHLIKETDIAAQQMAESAKYMHGLVEYYGSTKSAVFAIKSYNEKVIATMHMALKRSDDQFEFPPISACGVAAIFADGHRQSILPSQENQEKFDHLHAQVHRLIELFTQSISIGDTDAAQDYYYQAFDVTLEMNRYIDEIHGVYEESSPLDVLESHSSQEGEEKAVGEIELW